MIIDITAQGGFGGLAAASLHKTVDVARQPPQIRQELCEVFDPQNLRRLARNPCTDCADRMTYRITVTEDPQRSEVFSLREDQIPPEMLDLIDQM